MGKIKSIMTNDTKHCFICGSSHVDPHHCIHGYANKKWADKYLLIVPLCLKCHSNLHDRDSELDRHLQALAQEAFEREYPELNFREIFGKNYK